MRKYDYGIEDQQALWQQDIERRLANLEREVKLTSLGEVLLVGREEQLTPAITFDFAQGTTYQDLLDTSIAVPAEWDEYSCRMTWYGVIHSDVNASTFNVKGVTPDGDMNVSGILTSGQHGHPSFPADHTPAFEAAFIGEYYFDVITGLTSTGTQTFKTQGSWTGYTLGDLRVRRQILLVELTRTG